MFQWINTVYISLILKLKNHVSKLLLPATSSNLKLTVEKNNPTYKIHIVLTEEIFSDNSTITTKPFF